MIFRTGSDSLLLPAVRGLLALALAVLLSTPASAAPTHSDSVAIALKVVGVVRIVSEAGEPAVSSLMRFQPGTRLALEEGAELLLVFASGQRYRVGPATRVTIETASLVTDSGTVKTLPPVPALVELWPLVSRPGGLEPAAAARIRSLGELSPTLALSPSGAALVDGSALTLRFNPVSRARHYRVRIEEASSGRLLWSAELRDHRLSLPPNVLPTGATLYWEVEARDESRSLAKASAIFQTLREDWRRPWRALAAQVAAEPELAPLLATVDAQLGLPFNH